MPLLFWGASAITGLFLAGNALNEAQKAAQSVTHLVIIGGIIYFLALNPKVVKKFLGKA